MRRGFGHGDLRYRQVPELVALDLPAGPNFVSALQGVWDAGDAAMPLDPRLPGPATRDLIRTLRPTAVIGPDLERRAMSGGEPVQTGDALVIATSGSMGQPKGVVLTEMALQASALATTARLSVDRTTHRWLACLPLAHIGGLSVVTRALLSETPLTILPNFDEAEVEALGRSGTATHVSLVAAAMRRIDTGVFACILLGGAAPPRGVLPPNVVTTYGMTETGSGIVYDGQPLENVEIAIGNGEPGRGAEGEILVRAPMLLRCYRDGEDPRISGLDHKGGWFPTGDGGRIDSGGRLQVYGRMAEVVVTGGEKVWPVAVEQVLLQHPQVEQVAVWKRPDEQWGERVVAWVVPRDSENPPSLGALRELVSAELAPWAGPRQLELVASLPRASSGKVRRRDLK